jgi:hypothetical protein
MKLTHEYTLIATAGDLKLHERLVYAGQTGASHDYGVEWPDGHVTHLWDRKTPKWMKANGYPITNETPARWRNV